MNKFWTDICLIPFGTALAIGMLWCVHQGIHYQVKPVEPPANLFSPVDARDYGSLEQSCIKLLTRIELERATQAVHHETPESQAPPERRSIMHNLTAWVWTT